jgi:hypothetical protein
MGKPPVIAPSTKASAKAKVAKKVNKRIPKVDLYTPTPSKSKKSVPVTSKIVPIKAASRKIQKKSQPKPASTVAKKPSSGAASGLASRRNGPVVSNSDLPKKSKTAYYFYQQDMFKRM